MILLIETATQICSVGIGEDGKLLAVQNAEGGYSHSGQLTLLIQSVLKKANRSMKDLKAVAVSIGPGSYTGLRIGLSTAKGICFALDLPLIAVDTLESLASKASELQEAAFYIPMIDARRMEVYASIYDKEGTLKQSKAAKIIDDQSFLEDLNTSTVVFCGNGAEKCKDVIVHSNAIFIDLECNAANLLKPAYQSFLDEKFADLAYVEPEYLKPPNITKPKKLL